MDIRKDFRAAPVPIRMTCQYSNGITLSYYARALSLNPRSLRVLSAQRFDIGVQLTVAAPFLKGLTVCQVAAAGRSKKQPSFFELELKYLQKPAFPAGEAVEASRPVSQDASGLMVLVVAAAELADRLEENIGSRFSPAWQRLPAEKRPYHLMACVAAVALLLQEKGYLDVRHALLVAEEGLKK